jgi:hypothetical protein
MVRLFLGIKCKTPAPAFRAGVYGPVVGRYEATVEAHRSPGSYPDRLVHRHIQDVGRWIPHNALRMIRNANCDWDGVRGLVNDRDGLVEPVRNINQMRQRVQSNPDRGVPDCDSRCYGEGITVDDINRVVSTGIGKENGVCRLIHGNSWGSVRQKNRKRPSCWQTSSV